jgi:hypothetical protein
MGERWESLQSIERGDGVVLPADETVRGVDRVFRDVESDRAVARAAFAAVVFLRGMLGVEVWLLPPSCLTFGVSAGSSRFARTACRTEHHPCEWLLAPCCRPS